MGQIDDRTVGRFAVDSVAITDLDQRSVIFFRQGLEEIDYGGPGLLVV